MWIPYDRVKHLSLKQAGINAALDFGMRLARSAVDTQSGPSDSNPQFDSASAILEVSLPKLEGGEMQRKLLVQALRIGQFTLVASPGEFFAQTATSLRSTLNISNLSIVSCANGYIGYVPPKAEYPKGGYEIKDAPRLFGFRVPVGLAEIVETTAVRLVASIQA